MKTTLITTAVILFSLSLYSQDYDEFIGAGNDDGITITSSSSEPGNEPTKVIDGSGLDAERMEAARFLSQAGFGGNHDDIQEVIDLGYEGWLDHQSTLPTSNYYDMYQDIWDELFNNYVSNGEDPEDIFGPYSLHFNYAWWEILNTKEDMLRQRMAYALSQILVTSYESGLSDYAETIPLYYDILMSNALGNYEDLLLDVTKSTAMGFYLSHYNNPKADPANNVHPDENYAREIMQLFTIGLYELGIDGIPEEDANGDWIPTYDNTDIQELAKVFTGLGPGELHEDIEWADEPFFGLWMGGADHTFPMAMYEDWHETGEKVLLGGAHTIPDGQLGMEDVDEAVNFLFNHDNVGPFLAFRLIQRLVKSNPSPAYVQRVAETFNDNGSGERGDLLAVAKAILLDEEARSCSWFENPDNGKLKEPVLVLAQVMKSIPLTTPSGDYWNNGYDLMYEAGQTPMHSPSVFNFYTPDHAPVGPISDEDLVAPEFKIFNTLTAPGLLNKMHHWTLWNFVIFDWEDDEIYGENAVKIDEAWVTEMIEDYGAEGMMNELDILLTHGKLSEEWREEIRTATESFEWTPWWDGMVAFYLMLSHPDYMIEK